MPQSKFGLINIQIAFQKVVDEANHSVFVFGMKQLFPNRIIVRNLVGIVSQH